MKFRLFSLVIILTLGTRLFAAITVPGGTIDTDEPWTADNSPYIVIGNLTIDKLTIEPGVKIQFRNNYKFDIDGIFHADGFYSDSIYFQPEPGSSFGWKGIKIKADATVSLTYCRIEGGNDQGIRVEGGASPVISNCRIVNNNSVGLYIKDSALQIKHCIISNNEENGIYLDNSQITASNSIIAGNTIAGIFSSDSHDNTILTNCVVADNQANGIDTKDGALTIRNSIVHGNNDGIFWNSKTPDVTYSNIQGSGVFPGTGNINSPPDFSVETYYNLSGQSPCIDTGNPIGTDNDKYFPPSLGGTRNDMGAYGGPEAFGWYPPIYIKPESLDFGRVSKDSSLSLPVKAYNYRNAWISVTDIDFEGTNPAAFSTDKEPFLIHELNSTDISLTFTPDQVDVLTSDLVLGTIGYGNVFASLRGEGVVPDIDLPLINLDFGPVSLGDSSALDLPVLNLGGDTLLVNLVPPPDPAFKISKTTLKINPDSARDTVQVTFRPDSARNFQNFLILLSNDPDDGTIAITLKGEGLGPVIKPDQQMLDFGEVSISSDSLLNLMISNNGNALLIIDSLSISQPDTANIVFEMTDSLLSFPLGIEADNSLVLPLRFRPAELGLVSGQLRIYSNDPFRQEVDVQLRGTGLAPVLDLSSANVDFGPVFLTTDSTYILTIDNTGNDTLVIQSFSIPPTDTAFEMTDTTLTFPLPIEPGNNMVFPIRFKPVALGPLGSQISIQSNDPFQQEVLVPLSGTGVAPEISISVPALDFGQVFLSTDSTRQLTIENLGNYTLTIENVIFLPSDTVFDSGEATLSLPIHIEPDSQVVLPVRFKPAVRGAAAGQLRILSNDPFNSEDSVALSGTGFAPDLRLSTATLDFGQVTLDSSYTQQLTIENHGNWELAIDSLPILQPDTNNRVFEMTDSLLFPLSVEADSSLILPLRFRPAELGLVTGQLRIYSNDPLERMTPVELAGIGYSLSLNPEMTLSVSQLDFGSIPVSTDSMQIFTIYNIGPGVLIVPKDSLVVTGPDSNAFAIENISEDIVLAPNDSADIPIRFQPNQIGQKSSMLRIFSNDPINPIGIVALSGISFDNQPASIAFDPVNSSDPFVNAHPANISFKITSSSTIDSAFVSIRPGGKNAFEKIPLSKQVGTDFWATPLDSTSITSRGMEYFVCAYHGWTFTEFPEEGRNHPNDIPVFIPQIRFPGKTHKEIYQMISLPFMATDQDLNSLFSDDLGPYDNTKYRIFDCINGSDYTEITGMNQMLLPGKALWLITKTPTELDVENSRSVSTHEDFTLDLKKGWNMIATPFGFPVTWSDISPIPALRYYDGTDWQFASVLEPYKGYALKVLEDTVLSITPREATSLKQKGSTVNSPFDTDWYIQITVESGRLKDQFNYAGTHIKATSALDAYDFPEPPPIGEYVSVYFLAAEQEGRYSTDFRAAGDEGYIFFFELNSNVSAEKTIQINPENLPQNFDWMVVDKETGLIHETDIIPVSSNKTNYELIVGTADYIASAAAEYRKIPLKFKLAQNYPNPFNPATIIEYQLPHPEQVTIKIFNILGQHILTLSEKEYKEAGYHTIEWNGTNAAHVSVSSGIYFLQFRSGKYNRAIKMILQK